MNRETRIRLLSAAVLIPPLAFLIVWQNPHGLALATLTASILAQWELHQIAAPQSPLSLRIAGMIIGAFLSTVIYLTGGLDHGLAIAMAASLLLSTFTLISVRDLSLASQHLSVANFGLVYVSTSLACTMLLKKLPNGSNWIFLVLSMTWLCDTGAYFVGRTIGKRKLYPSVSPGKSVEGAIGGVIFSIGAATFAKFRYMPELHWLDVFCLSIPCALLGQTGDLVESMLKRGAGVKDSGNVIPGHGGILDRIDALLFTGPYVYLYQHYLSYLLN